MSYVDRKIRIFPRLDAIKEIAMFPFRIGVEFDLVRANLGIQDLA